MLTSPPHELEPVILRTGPQACDQAARILATWIAFGRNGTPDNPVITLMAALHPPAAATMMLDTACRVAHDPDREMRLLWNQVVTGNGRGPADRGRVQLLPDRGDACDSGSENFKARSGWFSTNPIVCNRGPV